MNTLREGARSSGARSHSSPAEPSSPTSQDLGATVAGIEKDGGTALGVIADVPRREMVPSDALGAVRFLAGPLPGFMTGQTVVVDGAYAH